MADNEIAVRAPEASLARLPNFEPSSISELELFATIISNSSLAPKDYRNQKENCMVAIMMGRELGLSPMQALQGIAVINGRPSVWGDAMWALVISHPEFAGFDEKVEDESATCTVKRSRRGVVSSVSESFSMADAERAGLIRKKNHNSGESKSTPWDTYPKRMMMWRARTFAARSLFADALKGLTSYEEASDYIEGEVVPPTTPASPVSAAAATGAPATAPKGDQPRPAAEEQDRLVTADELSIFNNARKASGWSVEQGRTYISETLKLKRSGEMRLSQLPAAMEWAKKGPAKPAAEAAPANPSQAAPASAGEEAATKNEEPTPEPEEERRPGPAEIIEGMMTSVEMGMFERDTFRKQHTNGAGVVDYIAMGNKLEQRMRDMGLAV